MILQVFENHLILKKSDLLWNLRISFSVYDFSFVYAYTKEKSETLKE